MTYEELVELLNRAEYDLRMCKTSGDTGTIEMLQRRINGITDAMEAIERANGWRV